MPSSVTYSSTRGGERNLDFRTVVMQGLAKDRGLFVPDTIPTITDTELQQWKDLSYAQVAVNVIAKFVQEDQVPTKVLQDIVTKSCAAFSAPDVTPLVTVHGHSILVRLINVARSFFFCFVVCMCKACYRCRNTDPSLQTFFSRAQSGRFLLCVIYLIHTHL
jgi:hypothetical protein